MPCLPRRLWAGWGFGLWALGFRGRLLAREFLCHYVCSTPKRRCSRIQNARFKVRGSTRLPRRRREAAEARHAGSATISEMSASDRISLLEALHEESRAVFNAGSSTITKTSVKNVSTAGPNFAASREAAAEIAGARRPTSIVCCRCSSSASAARAPAGSLRTEHVGRGSRRQLARDVAHPLEGGRRAA